MEKKIAEAIARVIFFKDRAEDCKASFDEWWCEAGEKLRIMEEAPEHYSNEEFEKAYSENDRCAAGAELWKKDCERWSEALYHLERALAIVNSFDD